MARPTKAKEAKPKTEGATSAVTNALGGFSGILINAALTIVIGAIMLGAIYLMMDSMLKPFRPTNEEVTQETEMQMSFPYDLDDFIINLNSPGERRYLKVKISLDIERHEGEPEIGAPSAGGGEKKSAHGGGAHGSSSEAVDPKAYYISVMEPFKMPIRDVIITKLSSMSAEELSSTPGKEQAKDAIKEEVNTILPEDRQVLRVNFGDFIIQ